MGWRRETATRRADREAQEALRRYLQRRVTTVAPVWVETVEEARRRADAEGRLERQLRSLP